MKKFANSIFAVAATTIGFAGLSVSEVKAKQCIWNKGGFVLNAKWYKNEDVTATKDEHDNFAIVISAEAQPIQEDEWPIAQGRCTRGEAANEKRTVILSVVGGDVATGFLRVGAGIWAAGSTAISTAALAAACPVTGVTCLLAGGVIAGGTTATGAAIAAIPAAKEVFYVDQPSETNYLDVWGTIWKPTTGPGGVIY